MNKCNNIISDALAEEQDEHFEILAMKRRNAHIVMYTGYACTYIQYSGSSYVGTHIMLINSRGNVVVVR